MKLILFGIGNYYQIQKPKLNSLPDMEIIAFSDNNPALWGTKSDGIPVIPPVSVPAVVCDKIIIVSLYVSEIFNQLLELGVSRDKILSWPVFWSGRMRGRIKIFSPHTERKAEDKKVLIISNDLNYDGASLAAVYAASALSIHWTAVLAVPLGNDKLIKEAVDAGISVAACPALPMLYEEEQNWMKQFDVVIVNTYPMIESALKARKVLPTLWWVHEAIGNYPIVRMQYPDGLKEKEFQDIHICAVSEIARSNFNSEYPGRLKEILPLGIPDMSRYGTLAKAPVTKEPDGKIVFAIIGVVYAAKGQEMFLDAAYKIDKGLNAEFWLIGRMDDTDYCRRVREKAESMGSVRILGELTRDQVYAALSGIDVVVCASREETLSITVIEGMMAGKACIAARSTGIAGYIEDGKNGFVVDCDDDALAAKMEWMIFNRDRLEDMGAAARKTYEDYFSMDIFGRRLEEMLYETEKEWGGNMG